MAIAAVSIAPVGEGTSVSAYVAEALRVVAHVAKSIMASPDFDASAFVGTVYKVTLERRQELQDAADEHVVPESE